MWLGNCSIEWLKWIQLLFGWLIWWQVSQICENVFVTRFMILNRDFFSGSSHTTYQIPHNNSIHLLTYHQPSSIKSNHFSFTKIKISYIFMYITERSIGEVVEWLHIINACFVKATNSKAPSNNDRWQQWLWPTFRGQSKHRIWWQECVLKV